MVAACDTSFLFSLYGNDSGSSKAVSWVSGIRQALCLNALTHFEFGNALRFAEFRKAIPVGFAQRYWAEFETAIAQGRLIVEPSNLAEVLTEAKRLSCVYTVSEGHRAFDILHVASAIKMKATHFLTFDINQKKLATAEGMIVPI